NGVIYCGSHDGKLYAVNTNGLKRWEYKTGAEVISSPTIASDGTIYVGSFDQKLYAINPDGTKRWEFATGDAIFSSPAIGADGTIYVGSLDSTFYAINPDGTKRWAFAVGDGIESSPAIGPDGTIYFGSYDHNLYTVPGDGPLANTPWPMFRHGLQHTGSVQAAPGIGNSALRPAHYAAPSTLGGDDNSTKNALGADTQIVQSEISADLSTLIRSQPSLNIVRQRDGTMGIEIRCETGRHYVIQTSTNLVDWTAWADFVSDQPAIVFEESRVANIGQRFYRIVAP
ncbi:MAG: PQQ-binding-like beta-propeller repeat protein, partial [Verrucomicrobiota bacterium]